METSMETLSTATSVREIVAREPDASGLLPYLEDRLLLPPPADVAERIWSLLVQDITPHSARAREQQLRAQYGEVPYAWFQHILGAAKTCQIDDFCLADLRQASAARWLAQMKQVDAFLASRAESWKILGPRFAEIRKLELEERALADDKAEVLRKAAPLRSQRAAQQQARARTLSTTTGLERTIQQLNVELASLELEHGDRSHSVDRMRSELAAANAELAQIHRQLGELRPVLARGANMLESDVEAVVQRVEAVRQNLSEIHSRGEAFAFTYDALNAVHQDLQRLVALKEQSQAAREQERAAEARMAPLQRRLDQLTSEHEAALQTNRDVHTQSEKAKADKQEAHLQVERLSERLKQTAAQLDALETQDKSTLKQLDEELSAKTKHLQELEAVVRSREQWLDDFHTAEAACTRMENELVVLRGWALSQAR